MTHTYTPEQLAEERERLERIQAQVREECRYVAAADDLPTIPVPPPSPEKLRPRRKSRFRYDAPPPDDRPTAPPPAHDMPNDPRYPR